MLKQETLLVDYDRKVESLKKSGVTSESTIDENVLSQLNKLDVLAS